MTRHISEIASGIIGTEKPAPGASSSIGRQRGVIGSAGTSATAFQEAARPIDNDRNLQAQLRRRFGSSIDIESRSLFEKGGFNGVAYGVRVSRRMTAEDRAEAAQTVEAFFAPLPHAELAKELAALKVTTSTRNYSQDDLDLQMAVYAEALSEYPADCAVQAIRRPRQWFPPLADILEVADRLSELRQRLRTALNGV